MNKETMKLRLMQKSVGRSFIMCQKKHEILIKNKGEGNDRNTK